LAEAATSAVELPSPFTSRASTRAAAIFQPEEHLDGPAAAFRPFAG
jgi:hypothetical protein